MHTASVNEADGVSAGDVAEGGEPSETTGQTRQAVGSRSGAADGFEVQRAPRSSCRAMIVITDTLTAVVVTGAVQDIAAVVGSVVNMNGVTGSDDDAKPARTTRT